MINPHTSYFYVQKGEPMKKSEKIEILEKEVTRLNELLEQSSAQEFVRLKEQMEKELAELRGLKARYKEIIEEVKGLKVELENNFEE